MPGYIGSTTKSHQILPKVGILLTNLGSPDAPTPKALRRYLAEFLWDPRIVELPRPLWWLILNGVILNIRPKRSAKAYQKVWTDQGSPLVSMTQNLAHKFHQKLRATETDTPIDQVEVGIAMRYGNPSIENALMQFKNNGVERLIVLALYPQYSASTTGSTFDKLSQFFQKLRWQPSLQFLPAYHDHPSYIQAIATSIQNHWQQNKPGEKLVFSYHGLPQKYLHKGDPYHCQCHKTSRLVAEQLELQPDQWMTCFQSRFGREPWLQPYTDITLEELAQQGLKSVDLISPGFSIDCLETIEEINMEARQTFIDAGGQAFEYIPCLNETDAHAELIQTLIKPYLQAALPIKSQAELEAQQAIIEENVKTNPNA